jgi:hypothetical protein
MLNAVFCVLTRYCLVVGYHLSSEKLVSTFLKMEAIFLSETFVATYKITLCHTTHKTTVSIYFSSLLKFHVKKFG